MPKLVSLYDTRFRSPPNCLVTGDAGGGSGIPLESPTGQAAPCYVFSSRPCLSSKASGSAVCAFVDSLVLGHASFDGVDQTELRP